MLPVALILLHCQFLSALAGMNGEDLVITSLYILFSTGIDLFTIVPVTQYVYLNYVASFECATNLTGYNVTFVYGPNITIDQVTETNLPNGAKKITFPATNEVNGSDIYCVARSESVVTTSTAAYIYIQGNLFAIMNAANDDLYACRST